VFVTFEPTTAVSGALLIMRPERSGWRCTRVLWGWLGITAGIDPDPANLPAAASWAQQFWQDLHASSAGGGYVNMMMEDDSDGPFHHLYLCRTDHTVTLQRGELWQLGFQLFAEHGGAGSDRGGGATREATSPWLSCKTRTRNWVMVAEQYSRARSAVGSG
jgi:hypothetical protein